MEIILHIGAHRTGSTALRLCSSANAALLRAEGTVVWRPADLRRMPGFRRVPALASRAARSPAARDELAEARADLARRLAALESEGIRRLLISEENILGTMRHNLGRGAIYPLAARNLAAYAAFLPVAPSRIGLGIREYGAWWLSVYAYVLRRQDLPELEGVAPRLAAAGSGARGAAGQGWLDIVAAVAAAFPAAEILVWRLEALARGPLAIACALLGRPAGTAGLRAPEAEEGAAPVNAGLRPADIPRLRALRAERPRLRERSIGRLMRSMPELPAPAYFTAGEELRMRARFGADLMALADGRSPARLIGEEPADEEAVS